GDAELAPATLTGTNPPRSGSGLLANRSGDRLSQPPREQDALELARPGASHHQPETKRLPGTRNANRARFSHGNAHPARPRARPVERQAVFDAELAAPGGVRRPIQRHLDPTG